jgi:hypothetical protein
MILGALAISTAVASEREHLSNSKALLRECRRYHLDYPRVLAAQSGDELGDRSEGRRWWDYAIVGAATGLFVWLGVRAKVPPLAMNARWIVVLSVVLLSSLLACGWGLWRRTRFS